MDGNMLLGILRDQIWQFLGFVATLVFGVLSILVTIYQIQQSRKYKSIQLSFSISKTKDFIDSNNQKISPTDPLGFLSKVRKTDPISFGLLKIKNTGNQIIHPKDFVDSSSIEFEKPPKILGYSTNPIVNDLNFITYTDKRLLIKPFLLNPGYEIEISLIGEDLNELSRYSFSISGLNNIDFGDKKQLRSDRIRNFVKFVFTNFLVILLTIGFSIFLFNWNTEGIREFSTVLRRDQTTLADRISDVENRLLEFARNQKSMSDTLQQLEIIVNGLKK
jgi:hypothetical protein